MFTILLILLACCYSSCSRIIDYAATKMITINDTDSYFGYSVLLQKGNPPIAIVGAPHRKYPGQNSGAVYKCNLETLKCQVYSRILREKGIYPLNKNGDFLGSVIVGDDIAGGTFFTCAPRFITNTEFETYFMNGRCYQIKNSSNIYETPKLYLPLKNFSPVGSKNHFVYYDAGFGESGFSIAYLKENSEILFGVPGKSQEHGGLIKTDFSQYLPHFELYSSELDLLNSHNYYGYDVAWGKFIKNSNELWYVSSAPRADDFKGSVIFFERNSRDIKEKLFGEEFGSYFGASLLVIHHKNGGDDILVSAPMYSGSSWDEGCVYYYRNNQNENDGSFYPPIKLSTRIPSSRFGSVLSDIGDINLDNFPDCAISAPYENDGEGAVYLFFGTQNGFSNDNFHRISPSNFAASQTVVRGFGMGVSKGTDIRHIKHNDIAIGAYKTGQVFYFKTHKIYDIKASVSSNMKTLFTSTEEFLLQYCLKLTYRNGDNSIYTIPTSLILSDSRVAGETNITTTYKIRTSEQNCWNYTVHLKKKHISVDPFNIIFAYKPIDFDKWEKESITIPVSYDCGSDNICHTDLKIATKQINPAKIILGIHNELRISVTITNSGEAAYQTKLYLNVPPELSLINLRECDLQNGSYVCVVAEMLSEAVEKHFVLDLANIQPEWKTIPINFSVDSIGQDIHSLDNKLQLHIPVVTQNNPHINSLSQPDKTFLNTTQATLNITHIYFVENQGPSPLNLNLEIFVPQINVKGRSLLRIESVEKSGNEIITECSYYQKDLPLVIPINQDNNSIILSCFDSQINCSSVVCKSGYLQKSSENVIFTVKMLIYTDSIVQLFDDKNKIVVTTSAYFSNRTEIFCSTASTVIYGISKNEAIPLWVYIVSVLSGIILLSLIIFGLYKCNFFNRTYREKLENERILCEENDENHSQSEEELPIGEL